MLRIMMTDQETNMAIVIEDAEIERLAKRIAKIQGVSVTEVMRKSLLSLANQDSVNSERSPLRERLAALAREVDAVPPRVPPDTRSDDAILGYNEHGAW
jgi:hypothetical protein